MAAVSTENSKMEGAAAAAFDDAWFKAALDLLGRTGMRSFDLRYEDSHEPGAWVALAEWRVGDRSAWNIGAGFSPTGAVRDLLEKAVDGGLCVHCRHQTAVMEGDDEDNDQLFDDLRAIGACVLRYTNGRYERTCAS